MNGVQAGQLVIAGSLVASTGALKIGGNAIWGEWFQGEIDEVRIYNRALNAPEITGDMNTSVSNPDASPPSAPGALSVVGWVELGPVVVGCGDRQRRRRPLQRPPRHQRRLHTLRRQPDRAADGALVHRCCRGRDVLLPGGCRGCRRQSRPRFERSYGDGRGHAGAVCAGWVGVRWVRWGGRRCRGRRLRTTLVCCATTCIAVRARGLWFRWGTGSRSRRRRVMWI